MWMPNYRGAPAAEPVVLPSSRAQVEAVARRCRRLVAGRALVSAGAALVPVPGVDIAADVGLLRDLISRINRDFGLTPEQIEQLEPRAKEVLYQALLGIGTALAGKVITRALALRAMQSVGTQVTARQAARLLPVAGQAMSAAISFGAIAYVGERHIRDCVRIAEYMLESLRRADWQTAEVVR
jgi:uncharacterized protein (DUF697 family)